MDDELKIDLAKRIVLADFRVKARIIDLEISISKRLLSEEDQNFLIEEVAEQWNSIVENISWDAINDDSEFFNVKNSMIALAKSVVRQEVYKGNEG